MEDKRSTGVPLKVLDGGKAKRKSHKKRKGPTKAKPPKESDPPVTQEQYRLKLIKDLIVANKVRANPRDYVVITQARQVLDVSGVYEIQSVLPDPLEEGNHVWVRGHTSSGREVVAAAIVIEDHVIRETTEGEQDCVMIRDEPRTKEWLVPRVDLSPLPLTFTPMLLHKSKLDNYLGEGWADVFWNFKLRKRRASPRMRSV